MSVANILSSIKDDCFKFESRMNSVHIYTDQELKEIDYNLLDSDLIEFVLHKKQRDLKSNVSNLVTKFILLTHDELGHKSKIECNDIQIKYKIDEFNELINSIQSKKFYQTFNIDKYLSIPFRDILDTDDKCYFDDFDILKKIEDIGVVVKTEIECTGNLNRSYAIFKYMILFINHHISNIDK